MEYWCVVITSFTWSARNPSGFTPTTASSSRVGQPSFSLLLACISTQVFCFRCPRWCQQHGFVLLPMWLKVLLQLPHIKARISSFMLSHQKTSCHARASCGGYWNPPWWHAPLSSHATTTACLPILYMDIPSTRCPCTKWTAAPPLRSCNYRRAVRHQAPPACGSSPIYFLLAYLPLWYCSYCYYCCCCCSLTADRVRSSTHSALISWIFCTQAVSRLYCKDSEEYFRFQDFLPPWEIYCMSEPWSPTRAHTHYSTNVLSLL